ncbi:MAG: hypothetical protein JNL74_05470 [Fibrobacteres bacterium]|nr:hypothetical protein [Fibrobacterota bacterium]
MISQSLLDIIVCPETRQPLRPADSSVVAALNEKITVGLLKNRAGEKVLEQFDDGLIREDGKILYPVKQDIPILLIDEGIPV